MSIGITEFAYIGYPVTDVDRAKEFYGGVLGLECTMDHSLEEEGKRWVEYEMFNRPPFVYFVPPNSTLHLLWNDSNRVIMIRCKAGVCRTEQSIPFGYFNCCKSILCRPWVRFAGA